MEVISQTNQNSDNQVRKILKNEVAQVIAVIAIVFSFVKLIILPIQGIEKDIQVINNNHLVHIQDSINDINHRQELYRQQEEEIARQLERTSTLIEQHIKDK